MVQKVTTGLVRDILLGTVREILYFPIWWYGVGLAKTAKFCRQRIKNVEMRLGVKIWIINLFKPMFGQRDIAGVLISFFMRVFQIIGRSIILIFWSIFMISLLLAWVGLPIAIILGIIFNLAAL